MQYVLITGVSTGVGYATAQYLLGKGYFVFGSVRDPERAKVLSERFGERFQPLIFDLCHAASMTEAHKLVEQRLAGQPLAALINNAGIAVYGPLLYVAPDRFRSQFEVNVFGTMNAIQCFAGLLGVQYPPHPHPGKIINISSIAGKHTAPFLGPYSASKHALESLSDGLRRELSVFNIPVVSIRPGPVKSDLWKKVFDELDNMPSTVYQPALATLRNIMAREENSAPGAERVAALVYGILQKKRPRRSYLLTRSLIHKIAFAVIPDKWLDVAYGWYLKRNLKNAFLKK